MHDSKPVLVTGCAGFIGWKVCEQLLSQGKPVVGIDNLNDAYDVRLKEWRLEQLIHREGFLFHKLDITDRQALEKIFHRSEPPTFTAVINLAARAGVRASLEDPWTYYATNQGGCLNLLDYCRKTGIRKFILASTSSLYGSRNSVPFREDADTDHVLSPYAASKKAADTLCYTYHKLYGLNITILRYFTVYGPAGRPDMSLFRFVKWIAEGDLVTIYGNGTQSRDFTYVGDIAAGTIAALDLDDFHVINLGSDRPWVLIDTVYTVEKLLGKNARLRYEPSHPADVPATWADITVARKLLGWEPCTSFENGLQCLIDWYLQNRSWTARLKV